MYSQHDEDDLIAPLLPDAGRFLDIGAFHPKDLSNTRLLYERGWRGVMIEPSPGPMRRLIDSYGTDESITLVQAMVGLSSGLVAMHVTDGPVSTSSEAVRRAWARDGRYCGRIHVPMVTIEDVISQFGPFDMVSIDAEGGSVDIFDRLLRTTMEPACIIVEHDGEHVTVERLGVEWNYRVLGVNNTNVVLVR